ncbi:hypothetical protein DM860_009156 [Cuscuta australis]|uniref:Uncharacterized protein n=1 Tax=Cuscuta australis TaxID=267555 RepID=A0A328DEM5_9ASTE|nr:hypothetical protein DM860_009156 [Cuscuta australis]
MGEMQVLVQSPFPSSISDRIGLQYFLSTTAPVRISPKAQSGHKLLRIDGCYYKKKRKKLQL